MACQREKTSTPFPAWRQLCNHRWMRAPPCPWLTFKEQKPDTTQTAAPSSMSGKEKNKSHCTTHCLLWLFLHPPAGRRGSQHAADLTGKRACSLLHLALLRQSSPFPFFSSKALALPLRANCRARLTGKSKAVGNGGWSSNGFRRAAAPASTNHDKVSTFLPGKQLVRCMFEGILERVSPIQMQ